MTLVVNTFCRDPQSNAVHVLTTEHHRDELAGFERCRRDLWGATVARRLGLTLLPSLSEQDLYVESAGLPDLEHEVKVLLQSLDVVARETGFGEEYIAHRAENILKAISRAREVPGNGVVVW